MEFNRLKVAVVVAAVLIPVFDAFGTELPERPNIVLIMADDLGWMDLGCQGNSRLRTPVLDGLAEQGLRFTNGYAAAPVCTPTRAAIMTGQSPARLRITNHAPGNGPGFRLPGSALQAAESRTFLDLDAVTIAERLRDAGYATGFFGKWHLSGRRGRDAAGRFEPRYRPEHQGFDVNLGGWSAGGPPSYFSPYRNPALTDGPEGEYLPERLAAECVSFAKRNRDRPFLLTLWNYSVHYPFQAPEELIAHYRDRLGPGLNNPTYGAMIEGMDRAIGSLLRGLEELGISENTLVLFTSDNGAWSADSRPLRGGKGFLWEGGIRVPWIVRWPGVVRPGTLCETPIISTDLFPTLLEVAGLEPDPDVPADGVSLVPLLQGAAGLERDALFFHYPNYAFHKQNRLGSAIREGRYKLIRWYDDNSVALFDLDADIGEQHDLATSRPQLAARLRSRLEAWLEQSSAAEPRRLPAADAARK